MCLKLVVFICCCVLAAALSAAGEQKKPTALEMVLENTKPLQHPRGGRPPLVLWTPNFPDNADDAEMMRVLRALEARGIALLHRWGGDAESTSPRWIRIGRMQKELGMPVCVDGTGFVHGFYSGRKDMAHVDAEGKPFFDASFFWQPGCPFTIRKRFDDKRKPVAAYALAYKNAGVPVDYWMADFEFGGPNEWNDAWEAAKKCTVCREKIKDIDTNFPAFQKAVRELRTALQREVWVESVRKTFPDVRIGNYGMNPHDGYRYWWDFYEKPAPGLPYKKHQNALYRPWVEEFDSSGYTLAMPVIYTWSTIYDSYNFENKQYRWFYNMLREATSVATSAKPDLPIIPFVHWSTTNPPKQLPENFEPMSRETYEELLWHMLLRGIDSFAMWSPKDETAIEVAPVHLVYASSLQYRDFLDKGTPVAFDVPDQPGTVVSALKLNDKLLVRRTDFTAYDKPVTIEVGGKQIRVERRAGQCQVLELQ